MITALLIGWPLVTGILVLFLKGEAARRTALIAAFLELAAALGLYYLANQYEHATDPEQRKSLLDQLSVNVTWIKSLGANFAVGAGGVSLVMVLLTALLTPIIIFSSFRREYDRPHLFYALILFMEMALIGVFTSMDGFLFYIFWELALLPIWLITLMWGTAKDNARVTFKFFIYTLAGSLIMLAGLIYLHHFSKSFAIVDLYAAGASLPVAKQVMVFWAFFLAFAIKMPVFPFHTWQPDTYVSAPMPGTMLLSGIMLKMGTYGLIRWLLPLVPDGAVAAAPMAIGLSVVSVVYASMMALAQKDFKRLVAYSSIAHVGLISAGILAGNAQGVMGGTLQMLSHGITVVGLFLIADIIEGNTHTREMEKLGGIRNVAPQFAVLFLVVLLGSVALPLTSGFVGEFLLITGLYQYHAILAGFAGLTIIFGAMYMLRSYQAVMLGETNHHTASFKEVSGSDKTVLVILAILIVVLGVYPKPVSDLAAADIDGIVKLIPNVKP